MIARAMRTARTVSSASGGDDRKLKLIAGGRRGSAAVMWICPLLSGRIGWAYKITPDWREILGPLRLGSVSIGIQPSIRSGASRPSRERTNARIGKSAPIGEVRLGLPAGHRRPAKPI